jgi:hypothetical protein
MHRGDATVLNGSKKLVGEFCIDVASVGVATPDAPTMLARFLERNSRAVECPPVAPSAYKCKATQNHDLAGYLMRTGLAKRVVAMQK